jgi:5-methylcytosine-specific restriction endonuclease McrA
MKRSRLVRRTPLKRSPPNQWWKRYSAYLKSDDWKELRQRTIAERGAKCELCGSTTVLHVHHKSYKHYKRPKDSNLQVVCQPCHQTLHPDKRIGAPIKR